MAAITTSATSQPSMTTARTIAIPIPRSGRKTSVHGIEDESISRERGIAKKLMEQFQKPLSTTIKVYGDSAWRTGGLSDFMQAEEESDMNRRRCPEQEVETEEEEEDDNIKEGASCAGNTGTATFCERRRPMAMSKASNSSGSSTASTKSD